MSDVDTDAGPTLPPEAFPGHLMPLDAVYDQDSGGTFIDSLAEGRKQIARVDYPWDGDAELLLGTIFAASANAAHELDDEYDPVGAVEALPHLLDAAEEAGQVLARIRRQVSYDAEDEQDALDALTFALQKARRDDE